LKDAGRLVVYLVLTVLVGALLAPILFWSAQRFVTHQIFSFLARYDFEKYFHRALLVSAIVLLWPLLRSLKITNKQELGLRANPHAFRDAVLGFFFAAVPLLCCGALLLVFHRYSLRNTISLSGLITVIGASVTVPLVEELFFRGLILGVLIRNASRWLAMFITAAFYSILHFLKTPEQTSGTVTWSSGLMSIVDSLAQFREPMLVVAGFTTLFLLGWILADARLRTRSLWLPIGLHAGWIFSSGFFSKLAKRATLDLPWLGKDLLIGILPLSIGLLTWLLLWTWLSHETPRAT